MLQMKTEPLELQKFGSTGNDTHSLQVAVVPQPSIPHVALHVLVEAQRAKFVVQPIRGDVLVVMDNLWWRILHMGSVQYMDTPSDYAESVTKVDWMIEIVRTTVFWAAVYATSQRV